MQILYKDEYLFIIDKPAGFFVHPPERSPYPVPPEKICLSILRQTQGFGIVPVHRLDSATSGLLIFARQRNHAKELHLLFQSRLIEKTYLAIVRGHLPSSGRIDLPLEIHGGKEVVPATTHYQTLKQIELPHAVGKRYPTARYSMLKVDLETGRWHQIRRHFDRIHHPLIGDIDHGDTYHNRFFRDELKIPGLCLRAQALKFQHPWLQKEIAITAPVSPQWQALSELFA